MPPPALVTLVVPAYNEARCLDATVRQMLAYGDGAGFPLEILIVDDGSADDTRAIADALANADPRVRALANPANQGKGAAVRRGMLAAQGDPVVFLDADLSTPVTTVGPLLDAFANGADVVIGSRRVPGADIVVHQPWLREALGRVFTWLTRTWLRVPVADFTCGFKGFRAATVRPIFERQRLVDWSFDAEILFLAKQAGYRITEVPVRWTNDADSKVRVGNAMSRALLGLWRIRWRHWTGRDSS